MTALRWLLLDAVTLFVFYSMLVALTIMPASITNAQNTTAPPENTTTTPTYTVTPGCGSNLTGDGNITSPYYPARYPNNAYCVWSLSASPGKVLQLYCLLIDLETNYDNIYVTSPVANKTSTYSYRLTGGTTNCSWILGETASVNFTSDSSIAFQGFHLDFRSITPPAVNRTAFTACGGQLNGSGIITSPSYPYRYPSNAYCVWTITSQGGNSLRFSANAYDVESSYDLIKIYDSQQINENATVFGNWSLMWWWWWSGSLQTGPTAVVVFSSDESVEQSGFSIRFWSDANYLGNESTSVRPSPASYPFGNATTGNLMTTSYTQVCGGNLHGHGNITTPGYPSNYQPYSWCSWTITAANGSAILLEFLDFALDKQNSYLNIWDNIFYYSYYLSGTDSNLPSLRLSSQITLYFGAYSNATNRGFSLAFTSVAAANSSNSSSSYSSRFFTSCGSNLTNEGNFTSPNYPSQYPNNAYCTWNIAASPGKVLPLFCISFDLENNYDSIYVTSQVYNKTTFTYDWFSGNSSNFSRTLGANATVSFSSDATVRRQGFVIGYLSITPPSTFNRTTFTQCGGNLTGSGNISSPNYPGAYPGNTRCIWRLKAFDGQVLRLYFNTYDVEYEYDTVLIYNSINISQGAAINYTSYWQGNMYWMQFNSEIVVVFASDESVERQGFQLYFTSEFRSSGMATNESHAGCGSNLTGDGNITSPYYPAQYPNNAYCVWNLSASPGKVLQIYCRFVDLETNYDNIYITSPVANKTSTYSYRLTGGATNCSWILGETASVKFTSDSSIARQGFNLGFRSIIPPAVNRTAFTACGGQMNGSGIITSPSYPDHYPSNAYCVWTITAQGGNSLRFSANAYDVESSFDLIKIYDSQQINENATVFGNGSLMWWWWWSGSLQTGPTAVVAFSSDDSVEQSGFSIRFWSDASYLGNGSTSVRPSPASYPFGNATTGNTTTTSYNSVCGGNRHGHGNITTPGYPGNYPPYSSCTWTITAANGSAILLEFLDFALDKQNSYLNIWDNVFYFSYYLSGTDSNLPSLRLSSKISLYFGAYSYATSRGFSLAFTSVAAANSTNSSSSYYSRLFTSCGSNLTNQGNFTSPNYPAQYPNNAHCTWNISASPGKMLQLFCISFDLENNYDSIYVTSQVYNKTTFTYDWFSGNSSNCSWTLGENATVFFSSDATVRRQGFVMGYRSITPPSTFNRTTFTQCGRNLTGSGNISSPNYPGAYPGNTRCIWRLKAFDGQVLRLYFNTYDLEYEYDTVLIYNSMNISQGAAINYSSYWQENLYWKQFNSEVVVVFESDESIERQGFQLYFTSEFSSSGNTTMATNESYVGCGSNLTGDGNITSPYYPDLYPNNAHCSWTLSASPGMILQLFCRSFVLENNYDYLYITTQGTNKTSTYADRLTGFSSDCSWILGPTALVTFASDSSIQRQGFLLGFRSIIPTSVNRTTFTEATVPTAIDTAKTTPQPATMFSAASAATPQTTPTTKLLTISTISGTASQPLSTISTFLICGGSLESYGEIWSPNFPSTYPNNVTCIWTFSAENGYAYKFQFLNFSTENLRDYVEIQTESTEIHRFSGSRIPAEVLIGGNGSVYFTSSESVQLSGFRIRYNRVATVTTTLTARSIGSGMRGTMLVAICFTSSMVIF